ncbi:Mitochondrial fission 1 protein [Halotydeus destructor]|nr:Mitochondrial fission 1 protein [Halotydeus destructor]
MEALLDHDTVHPDELKKFEQAYYEQLRLSGAAGATARTRFEYAWCLVRSKFRADIKRGILILEDLCATGDEEARRDYLFYLAVANTKLGDYQRAQECCTKFLAVEPQNRQAQELLQLVKQRMTKEGLKGLAVAGGAALVVGGLLGLGMALAKK